ncbi:MAG: hypothetical protein CL955_05775 [Erythrobacteraceae bacterium]|nr:hypothetical protein [Erythrobacteraceae bacterium]
MSRTRSGCRPILRVWPTCRRTSAAMPLTIAATMQNCRAFRTPFWTISARPSLRGIRGNIFQIMQLSDKFTVSGEVVAREMGGEMVLLDLASGQYFGLDPVGMRVWELLSESPQTLAQLCDVIEAEFEAPRGQIEADLLELASELNKQGLIVAQTA